jgi:multiple sugar transport system permease protein
MTATAQTPQFRTPSLKKALLTGTGVLVMFFFLAPYIQMFITSLTPAKELYDVPANYLPSRFEFSNFIDVWSEAPLWGYLRSSLIIAGFATVLVLVVALPAAYYTARYQYRGRLLFLLLVLITQMFAPTALVIGIYREFVAIGDIFPSAGVNTYLSLIIVNAAFNLAFSTWIMVAYFSTIPVELEEAASIDGASRLGVLRRVTLPLALPGIITATIFTFIAAWNEFVVALTLAQSPDIHPLTVGVTTFIGQYRVEWQYLFTSSLIAIVPVVILFIVIEKWLVGGLTAGSIK